MGIHNKYKYKVAMVISLLMGGVGGVGMGHGHLGERRGGARFI
jgi:hypothetical protein